MKLSNFKFIEKSGEFPYEMIHATVDIETGCLWWKKKQQKAICKGRINWFFEDNGEFIPEKKVKNLVRSYEAKNKIKL